MGLVVKSLQMWGDEGTEVVETPFDTGARVSVIRRDIAEKTCTIIKLKKPKEVRLADEGYYNF